MIPCVRVKEGVEFVVIAPGGFIILAAIQRATMLGHDLTITSGSDGEHSGPEDPHHRGEAYDVRTNDLPNKELVLMILQNTMGDDFFAFIEDEGTENEHIHIQVKKGTVYPPLDPVVPA